MVALIGCGMGEDDLITLKAQKFIASADAILYDRLIDKAILLYAKPTAHFIDVGKEATEGGVKQQEIHALLLDAAGRYNKVARLHGGDPCIFGRGGEELDCLKAAGIPVQVIPGVSSSYAAASYAGIALTHRYHRPSFHVYTAHRWQENIEPDYREMASLEGTLVFLMGSKSVAAIAEGLIKAGKKASTPLAIVKAAATQSQQVFISTLAEAYQLTKETALQAPLVFLIGDGLNEHYPWFKPRKTILFVGEQKTLRRLEQQADQFSFRFLALPTLQINFTDHHLAQINLQKFKAALFTSVNAVEAVARYRLFDYWPRHLLLGAVGPATAKALKEHGLDVTLIPEQAGIRELGQLTQTCTIPSDLIAVFSAREPAVDYDQLSDEFDRQFIHQICYESKPFEQSPVVMEEVCSISDYVVFTSGLAAENFFAGLCSENKVCTTMQAIAFGSSAAKVLNKQNIKLLMNVNSSSLDELIRNIEEFIVS